MSTNVEIESWTEDYKAEQVISSLGMDFDYMSISPQDIDRKSSRFNRARIEPINQDVAKEYAAAFEMGARFPAIVACELPSSKMLVIAGGNHRDEAWSCVLKRTDPILCIVCSCDRMEFDLLCKSLNAVEGVRASTELRIMQAAEEVEQWGSNAVDAARRLNVPVQRVTKLIDLNHWRSELAARGYRVPPDTSETALFAVKQLARERPVLDLLMDLVKAKVPGSEIRTLVNAAKLLESEAERVVLVTEYLSRLKPQKKSSVKRPNYNRILDGLTRVENVLAKCTLGTQLQIPDSDIDKVVERCETILATIKTLTSGSATQGIGSKKTGRQSKKKL